jgi:hypothetical protein
MRNEVSEIPLEERYYLGPPVYSTRRWPLGWTPDSPIKISEIGYICPGSRAIHGLNGLRMARKGGVRPSPICLAVGASAPIPDVTAADHNPLTQTSCPDQTGRVSTPKGWSKYEH